MPQDPQLSELPRSQVLFIDGLCEDFEAAWDADSPPVLEEWLSQIAEELRPISFRELLKIECALRERRGEHVLLGEYLQRFSEHRIIVEGVLNAKASSYETLGWQVAPQTLSAGNLGVLGNYVLLSKLGQGGMGVVYKARDKTLNRLVALKLLLAGNLASPDEIERFRLEATAAAHLDHPHIVPIYEIGEHNGKPFFALKYISGPSLQDLLREGPLEMRNAARLLRTIAEAAHHAHQQGVVHRDLKPANILLTTDGEPCITDFGLAKRNENDSGLTATGQVLGTPGYMPPEQAAAKMNEVDAVSDVYSLGGVLYCMLTGRAPFQAANIVETLKQVIEQEPARPKSLNSAVDRDLETICLKCLEKEKEKRYPSADELAHELARYLNGEAILARRASKVELILRWCKRKPLAASLVLLSALLVGLMLAVGVAQIRLRTAQQVARVHEYYGIVEGIRTQRETRSAGWSLPTRAAIHKAALLMSSETDSHKLRTLAAEVLTTLDAKLLADGNTTGADTHDLEIAIDHQSKMLAWSRRGPAAIVEVNLFDLEQLKTVATLRRSVIDTVNRNRIRTLDFSPDGKWLVAGMRDGQIWCWNKFEDGAQPFQEINAFLNAETKAVPNAEAKTVPNAEILDIAFSSDSKTLLACGDVPGPLKRWSLETTWIPQLPVCELCDYFAVSPDGRWIASSGDTEVDDKKVRGKVTVRDAKTLQPLEQWSRIVGSGLCFSPDSQLLSVTNSDQRSIQVYSVPSAKKVRVYFAEPDRPDITLGTSSTFGVGGQILAASCDDSRIRIWDVPSGQILLSVPAPGLSKPHFRIAPNGKFLAVGSSGTLSVLALEIPAANTTLAVCPETLDDFSMSLNGERLFTLGEIEQNELVSASFFREWNLPAEELVSETNWLVRPGNPVSMPRKTKGHVTTLSSGDVMVGGSLGSYRYRSTAVASDSHSTTGFPRPWLELEEAEFASAKGKRLAFVEDPQAGNGKALRLSPGETATVKLPLQLLDRMRDGLMLVLVVRVEGQPTLQPVFEFNHQVGEKRGTVRNIAGWKISPGYQYYMVDHEKWYPVQSAPEQSVTIRALDEPNIKAVYVDRVIVQPLQQVQDSSVVDSFNKLAEVQSLLESADGKRIWGIEDEERVVSWDPHEVRSLTQYDNRPARTTSGDSILNDLAEADGLIYVAARNGNLLLLDAATGQPDFNATWTGPGGAIRCVAIDQERNQVALATDQGLIEIRDLRSKSVVAKVSHADSVECLKFSSDGAWLVSAGKDRTIRIWRRDEFRLHPLLAISTSGPVQKLALSSDRTRLAALVEGENAVRVWQLEKLNATLSELSPHLGW